MREKPDRAIKIHPEYHLIVTEETDTEPTYFGAITEIINRQYPEKIQLDVSGEGDHTISLFEKAKTLAGDSPNVYLLLQDALICNGCHICLLNSILQLLFPMRFLLPYLLKKIFSMPPRADTIAYLGLIP